MAIDQLSRKISKVPVNLIQIFFKDREVFIPRSIRYQVLKTLIEDEIKNEDSEIWNYYNKNHLENLESFCEFELESILFSLEKVNILPRFKELFWEEVISNQYIMGVNDKFFPELSLLASNDEDERFIDYYNTLNEVVCDSSGFLDGQPYPIIINRIKKEFDYFQIIYFILKYRFASEDNVQSLILAYQINKTIDERDENLDLKKTVMNNLDLTTLEEIATKLNLDLSEDQKINYAREFLLNAIENPTKALDTILTDEEIEQVVKHYLPLGKAVKERIAEDEKTRYANEFKRFSEKETRLMNNLINYNKNTNLAIDILDQQIKELIKKNQDLEEKIDMISQYTGVGYVKNYRLKRYIKIGLFIVFWIISVVIGVFIYKNIFI